ncbi:extensin-like [Mizuhopecten yessoensis]|uniref:Methylcytosine dioxygenase TET1 n=1 Tax=Mizuhopecten yessoensis TaxID=6573 RepID=A0A210R1W4_MIZYE|nr:extensin-like [Mizuhopecten yessoensis]OWF54936.1 Methylcytosine dioxygenase TET1 [Mizuhopecten yessoensis]
MEDGNGQFPLHIQTGDGEFIVKEEEDLSSPTSPDYYTSPDGSFDRGVRLKRRRRCGQCGPCQVKENCNKCHFCVRRDVLKQTCMYRKCVYLRSKPKPYSRPKETPLASSAASVLSPNSQEGHSNITSPTASGPSRFLDGPSPPNRSDVAKPIMPPKLSDHFPYPHGQGFPSFEPIIRPQGPCSAPPAPGHTPHRIPTTSPAIPASVIGQHAMVPGLVDQSSLSHNHQIVMPPPPPTLNDFNERTFSEFRSQHMLGMSHNQVHSTPHPFGIKDPPELSDVHFPPYGRPDSQRTPTGPSSCVYPHGIAPSMAAVGFNSSVDSSSVLGSLDRQTRAFFPTHNTDMFRHFPPLPPGYAYPSGRYGQNFTSPHYPRFGSMGMPPPPPPPPPNLGLKPQGGHTQPWGFTPTYSSCEQSNGCPKNGCCPPVSKNLGSEAQVMQEIYGNVLNSRVPYPIPSPIGIDCSPSQRRPGSAMSDDSGRMSMASSDFESDVISIDDCQMNALIRSDGSNSLQIEIGSSGIRTKHDSPVRKGKSKFTMDSILAPSLQNLTSPHDECEIVEDIMVNRKCTINGTVYVKQDLGDSGVVQLEIPGNKVTLEDSYLDDKLAGYSSNLGELLEFIRKEPQIEFLRNN